MLSYDVEMNLVIWNLNADLVLDSLILGGIVNHISGALCTNDLDSRSVRRAVICVWCRCLVLCECISLFDVYMLIKGVVDYLCCNRT